MPIPRKHSLAAPTAEERQKLAEDENDEGNPSFELRGFTMSALLGVTMTVMVVGILSDGNSLMYMRNTNKEFGGTPIKLLPGVGYPYGMGINHDTFRKEWGDGARIEQYIFPEDVSDHPGHFTVLYNCDQHNVRGKTAKACVYIIMILNWVIIAGSCVGNFHPKKKRFGILLLVCCTLVFLFAVIAVCISAAIYDQPLHCIVGGFELKTELKTYFEIGHAIPVLVATVLMGFVNLILVLKVLPTLKDDEEEENDDSDANSQKNPMRP